MLSTKKGGFMFVIQDAVIRTRSYLKVHRQGSQRPERLMSPVWLFVGNYPTSDCLMSKTSPNY